MTSPSWEALVVEGKNLSQVDPLDRWAIGDLAIRALPPGRNKSERSAVQDQLRKFADDTGISFAVLKDCHRTSAAWPVGRRFLDISQAKHSRFASRPNRVDLLLNEDMADGLSSRVRDKVEKVEELLADKETKAAVIARSKTRSRRTQAAARAIEDEDLTKARVQQRLMEQDAKAQLAAPEIMSKAAERAIKGNLALAKMVTELLDLRSVISDIPEQYHERTIDNLSQIARAAQQVLDILRPDTQSPQPRTIIITAMNDHSGVEHL